MKAINKKSKITIYWKIWRGVNKVTEDFSNLSTNLKVFLMGHDDVLVLNPSVDTEVDPGYEVLKMTISEGKLGVGAYGIKAVWTKNDGRDLLTSMRSGVFGITDSDAEASVTDEEIRLVSSVESYGRDGMSAFETAVMRNLNNGISSEVEWVGNEAKRIADEEARDIAETAREEAEEARKSAESGRVETFNTNEETRQTAFETNETNRGATFTSNETSRENAYLSSEQDREVRFAAAEEKRNKGEAIRQAAFEGGENNRATTFTRNEESRQRRFEDEVEQRAEDFNAYESSRQRAFEQAERDRGVLFSSNEKDREANELNREQAETIRNAQESIRQQAEQIRIDTFDENERERIATFNANEAARIAAENERKQNEAQREANEAIRQESYKDKLPTSAVVQETGDGENVVMSQKAVSGKLAELGSKVGGVIFKTFTVSVGNHSSNNDTIDISVKKGDKFSILVESSENISESFSVFAYYIDGTNERLGTVYPNQVDNFSVSKDMFKVGIYFSAKTEGVVNFTVTGGFKYEIETQIVELNKKVSDLELNSEVLFSFLYNKDAEQSNVKIKGHKVIIAPDGFGIEISIGQGVKNAYYIATTTGRTEPYEYDLNSLSSQSFLCIDISKLVNIDARNETEDVLVVKNTQFIDYRKFIPIAQNSPYVNSAVFVGKALELWGIPQEKFNLEQIGVQMSNVAHTLFYNNDASKENVRIESHSVIIKPNGFGIKLGTGYIYYIATTTGRTEPYEYKMSELKKGQSLLCIDISKLTNVEARNEVEEVLVVKLVDDIDYAKYIPIAFNSSYTEESSFVGQALHLWGIPSLSATIKSDTLYEDLIPYIKTLKKKTPYGYNRVNNPLVLLWFSDIHAEHDNLQRIVEWKNLYSEYIDDILNTGDTIDDTLASYDRDMGKYFENGGDDILIAIGNHDVATPNSDYKNWDGSQSILDIYNKYVGKMNAQKLNVALPSNAVNEGYNFYYKDYPNFGINEKGIRLIVIDSCITDEQYQFEQLNWMSNILTEAKSKDYAVVIASHFLPLGCTKMSNAKGWAYETDRLNVSPSSVDERLVNSVDEFINNGGHFVTWLCGHVHGDYLGVVPNHENQLVIAITSSSRSVYAASSVMPVSMVGTKTQEAFNHIEFDTYNKQIKMLRIGYDIDALGREIKMITIDYQNKNVIV